MSNLRLINETTASSVSSVSITDVFSSDFDIYKISIVDIGVASGSGWVNMKLINSGGSTISSNYSWANLAPLSYASFAENKATSASVLDNIIHLDSTIDVGSGALMYIFNPNNSSSYTFMLNQSSGVGYSSGALNINAKMVGVHKSTETISGFAIFPDDTTTFTDIAIKTYGLRVDS